MAEETGAIAVYANIEACSKQALHVKGWIAFLGWPDD
jgi:hypothetical protein